MEPVKLGQILQDDEQRDAIHIAIAPVIADEKLAPGQDIGFVSENDTEHVSSKALRHVGIVDPFLKALVFPGQRFYMLLYPNTITSLRHEWVHPVFDKPKINKAASESWLRAFADDANMDYGHMLEVIRDYVENGQTWIQPGSDSARSAFYQADKVDFWHHVKNVTGLNEPDPDSSEHFGSPFCCSC